MDSSVSQRRGMTRPVRPETFRRLLRELDALNIKQPMFFASHPAVSDRIANYMAMSKQAPPGGSKFADEYLIQTASARVAALDGILREGNGKLLVHLLEREDLLTTCRRFADSTWLKDFGFATPRAIGTRRWPPIARR